ncbi:MAG: MBL fold metallo-hydrolase [Gemmatimonadota bacterium]|nr:MBL fold metallo-hydrolase [Gemmatimonadota bacterium]MDE3006243.1 MBL fold metallo-hydrolase [Gemmatimonadota bacterium]MDE3014563.1 MBL fold metallo-hydrolase [Gemmatimonadota bacterium]
MHEGLPLSRSIQVGSVRMHGIEAGVQQLDGGAMFGVVPKPLWERRIPADLRNRIPLALRCLLVEAPNALVLIDTGIGNKYGEKFADIYGVLNAGEPTRLEDGIRDAGFDPADVDIVLSTHLHFDHAGGNTVRDESGVIRPSFPNARYVVQRGELDFAHSQNERIRASYLLENFEPITEAGLWHLVEGEADVTEGISVVPTPGHTPHHQSVLIRSDDETACFLADVCPTSAHLPLPWIMGYDLEPLVTLESKRGLWQRAREEDWLLVFEHDPRVPWGRLDPAEDRPVLAEDVALL